MELNNDPKREQARKIGYIMGRITGIVVMTVLMGCVCALAIALTVKGINCIMH